MADGKVIVIANGAITTIEVAEPVEADDAVDATAKELEAAKAKIAELEAAIADAEKSKPDLVATEASMKAKEAEAVALVADLTKLKNTWKPAARSQGGSVDKVDQVDLTRVKELNKELNKESNIKTE
jgi:hypothetical protein